MDHATPGRTPGPAALRGLYTRSAFERVFASCRTPFSPHDQGLPLVMLRVDHLEALRDRYGQACCDQTMTRIGQVIERTVGPRDVAALCDRLGLVAYWTETGTWPDCATDASLPYDFRNAVQNHLQSRQGAPSREPV